MSCTTTCNGALAPGAGAPPPAPSARATRREWIGLAVIALPCIVYAMDLTVLDLALPALSAELKPSGSQLLWIIDIYGFLVAGFLITMGTLGDRIGRRRLLLAGAAAFALASTLAAFARTPEQLIVLRALLGIAGATLAPSTMSLIRNMFRDAQQRQFAIGVWVASYSAGAALGPLVGGLLLHDFAWHAVFLAAVPVMLLLLALGPRLLPEYRDPAAGRVDPLSVAQSLAAVLGAVYALKQMAEHGPSAGLALLLLASLAIGALFVRRQGRLAYPLLELRLLRQPGFAAAIAAYGLASLAMFGIYVFIAQYLQLVLGLAPLQAGFATLPWALGFIAGSLLTPRLARRFAPATVLVGGLAVAACGFALLIVATGSLALLVGATVVMSLALAPVVTIGNEMIITAAPPERAGAASAIAETAAEFSGALGIALLGSLGMALYRHLLAPALPPGLEPAAAADALGTLGGTMSVAAALGAGGPALAAAARSAFSDALQLAAAAATAILLLAGFLAMRLLRRASGKGSAS